MFFPFGHPPARTLACTLIAISLAACHRAPPTASGQMPQRGYLWQRDWTPAVADAASEADRRMDGLVLLGAEILWDAGGKPRVIAADVPWAAVKGLRKPCAVGLRVAPFTGKISGDDATARAIVAEAKSLLADAAAGGVKIDEFELDFDCAQKRLADYRAWVSVVKQAVKPARLVITTLPAWLDEPEFRALVGDADGYVLQVHSVPTARETGRTSLCDPVLARKWVAKAAQLGLPFTVALPTYRCLAGYDASSGKLLGVMMDSVQPAWPSGTHVLDFATDADGMAALVREWTASRPAALRGIIWYRVPVASDALNWRWPTLAAVMAGRSPAHKLEVKREGDNPVDLSIENNGEADERVACDVVATWSGPAPLASDALGGWSVRVEPGRAVFSPEPGMYPALPPGAHFGIGWLRYENAPDLQFQVVEHSADPR